MWNNVKLFVAGQPRRTRRHRADRHAVRAARAARRDGLVMGSALHRA